MKPTEKAHRDRLKQHGATIHAADRLWERYGMRLTRTIVQQIHAEIRSGRVQPEFREGLNLPVYVVPVTDEHGTVNVPLLWDENLSCIVTVLPS